MTVFGVAVWRFALGVIAAEAVPILLLVIAMFPVGLAMGGRPSQETAAAWGAWIGPIGGTLSTCVVAYLLARISNAPVPIGIALGVTVAALDLGLTLLGTRGEPFKILYAVSALCRLAGGTVGGFLVARGTIPPG